MSGFDKAKALIHEFKRDSYAFGPDVLPRLERLFCKVCTQCWAVRALLPLLTWMGYAPMRRERMWNAWRGSWRSSSRR